MKFRHILRFAAKSDRRKTPEMHGHQCRRSLRERKVKLGTSNRFAMTCTVCIANAFRHIDEANSDIGLSVTREGSKPNKFQSMACLLVLLWALPGTSSQAQETAPLKSGVILENFDPKTPADENFYLHVNNAWLERTEIPADKARYGAFIMLDENVKDQVRAIIEELGSGSSKATGPAQQVGDFYKSYIDEEARNRLGWQPIKKWLKQIEAADSKQALAKLLGDFEKQGIASWLGIYIDQDAKRSDRYAVHLAQTGISLPDRDYYLLDDQRYVDARGALKKYASALFLRAGKTEPDLLAEKLIEFETALAKVQWTQVEQRDPLKTYNKVAINDFASNHSSLHWLEFAATAGLPIEGEMIVGQPSFFEGLDRWFKESDLDSLKSYASFRVMDAFAGVLDVETERLSFDFHETALSGVTEQQPLWKRGVEACSKLLGMPVGQLYVAKHFSPAAKERMQRMVETLKQAFADRLQKLEWMSDGTKKRALEKLASFSQKIGYPDRWKDYSSVVIQPDSIVENLVAIRRFEHGYALNKLGKPIDRGEWLMPPQMVNAYYNPQMNEIVFPAAILQPPFFNLEADDAVNYGGIGAVIGHEISHGFDDQGSKYDGQGNLRDWWTNEDRTEFERRSQQLVKQYSAYKPFDDMNVNGELTLGENIGDLGGLNAALSAYRLSLGGKTPPVIDGYSGEQRFFIGWAQVWLFKFREAELRRRLLTDPHSPAQYRTNGIVSNLDAFYEAFSIKPNSKMWIEPAARVKLW
jgi:putative endopeptidase